MKLTKSMALLTSALLVACGGASTSSAETSSYTRREIVWDNPYADTATETVTLSVWGGETDAAQKYLNMVCEDFNKANPKAKYTLRIKPVSEGSVSGDWKQDPAKAADLAICADDQLPEMIAAGYLQNLTTLGRKMEGLVENLKDRNSAESIEAVTNAEDNKLYGFPVSASNGYVLYYNSALIKPEDTVSFESLLAAIKRASDEKGKSYKFGFPSHSGWYLDGWFRSAGFSVYGDPTAQGVVCDWNETVEDHEGTEVAGKDVAASLVKLAHGQYRDQWASMKQDLIINQVGDDNPNQIIATINGTWNYDAIRASWGDANTAATVLPKFHVDSVNKDYNMWSVKGFKVAVVNAKADSGNVVMAGRFAEFLSNYEEQVLRFDLLHEAPTNVESVKLCDYATNPVVSALSKQWEKGGFVEKVNSHYWNPSDSLSDQLCAGTAGKDLNFITSGAGTKDIVVNLDAIQTAIKTAVDNMSK